MSPAVGIEADALRLLDEDPVAGLRVTVALIRERAEATTSGPWWAYVLGSEGYEVRANRPPTAGRLSQVRVARCGYEEWDTDKANAEHIASWHPAVALAVADWLERDAEGWSLLVDLDMPELADSFANALAVARTYLGGDA